MSQEQKRARVTVSGTVQGVYFRASCRDEARRVGATGWVRNLPSGVVEALFEGDVFAVAKMIAWMENGPSAATVTHRKVEWEAPKGEFVGFNVTY